MQRVQKSSFQETRPTGISGGSSYSSKSLAVSLLPQSGVTPREDTRLERSSASSEDDALVCSMAFKALCWISVALAALFFLDGGLSNCWEPCWRAFESRRFWSRRRSTATSLSRCHRSQISALLRCQAFQRVGLVNGSLTMLSCSWPLVLRHVLFALALQPCH